MTYIVRFRPEAEEDTENAARWYEEQKEGLGHRFLDQILETIQVITDQPALFPIVHRRIHRALIHKFPFGIYYRIEKDTIVVVAVMHGHRNPRQWQSRR